MYLQMSHEKIADKSFKGGILDKLKFWLFSADSVLPNFWVNLNFVVKIRKFRIFLVCLLNQDDQQKITQY